ncbi:hypothetical protein BST63_02310 [Bradyrhizobium canariense]|uniref:Transposase IS66 C-terminal domain-containing protein n=1 Tax=Bradyrhizobium canariense TaxID=255045 RepID=A0ABX3XAV0_9BRAD|nr:hypothetical protein BSR47_04450 [Bradyrhizobium canariense]OSJ35229.1 hypothetical protein BST63_02310 [Bradyrhizobium canariense]
MQTATSTSYCLGPTELKPSKPWPQRRLRSAGRHGRRSLAFGGSDEGGRRAAAICSLIASTKVNVDPHAWLADVLARLPDHPARRIHELVP